MKIIQTILSRGKELDFIIRIKAQNVFQKFRVSRVILNDKNFDRILLVHAWGVDG
jgi:hypothetical protein